MVENLNLKEADQLAIYNYKRGRGVKLGDTKKQTTLASSQSGT